MPKIPFLLVKPDFSGEDPLCFLPSRNHPGKALVPPYWRGMVPIYPWGEWCDRRGWFILHRGVDFKCTPEGLCMGLRRAAKSRNLTIRISIKETSLHVYLEEKKSA